MTPSDTTPIDQPIAWTDTPTPPDGGALALWNWRRRIAGLYSGARADPDDAKAWQTWRRGRDDLFGTHSQSPLDPATRRAFRGLAYFDYDPALRFEVALSGVDEPAIAAEGGSDGAIHMRPFARTEGLAERLGGELTLFWIGGYGGGAFLPFTDGTSGQETYGGGRYLLDTIKGADLGERSGRQILDFNFAYNPSCCYAPRYVCPLAPRGNRLPQPVRGGELA